MLLADQSSGPYPLIVFSDLDGTLLDHYTYSFDPARPALDRLRDMGIPVILATSKTMAELAVIREQLGLVWPVIIENGGGVAFDQRFALTDELSAELDAVGTMRLKSFGPERQGFLPRIAELSKQFRFTGFSELGPDGIAMHTGLEAAAASAAADRQFSEPLLWQDSEENQQRFAEEIARYGLRCVSGGRFLHVMGRFDKASAIQWLMQQLPRVGATTRQVVLGDSANDIGMLEGADTAVVIKSPVHPPPRIQTRQQVIYTEQTGPAGWNHALLNILDTLI